MMGVTDLLSLAWMEADFALLRRDHSPGTLPLTAPVDFASVFRVNALNRKELRRFHEFVAQAVPGLRRLTPGAILGAFGYV
jgi:hypothetical protein